MVASDNLQLANRFQRAVRIDSDAYDSHAIDGFLCPPSSAGVISVMVDNIAHGKQCAFTWTGPYGSGKSSLVVFFCALLSQDVKLRKRAFASLNKQLTAKFKKQFGSTNWRIIPVVGRRESPIDVIGEALESQSIVQLKSNQPWTESRLMATVEKMVKQNAKDKSKGTILFIDEMGKFLESKTSRVADPYIFQQLAEIACRSEGKFIFIGVLHQAFGDYANQLSRIARDEWMKVQGRFVDITVRPTMDEQIYLLSLAINSTHPFKKPNTASQVIANAVSKNRPQDTVQLAENLERCWPLHPAVACLLGPLSQSRFGQNQRSIFSFLSSGELFGFQEHLRLTSGDEIYKPFQLWDYLRTNFESSIAVSSDGHRWALAIESVDRCEGLGDSEIEIKLVKTIALLDFFRNRSRLPGNFKVLCSCLQEHRQSSIRKALEKISSQSLVVHRKFNNSYSVYAGSDFDIDRAIAEVQRDISETDFPQLNIIAGVQPILAKRHYYETGAMRWCKLIFTPLSHIKDYITSNTGSANVAGLFIVAIPTNNESPDVGRKLCWDLVNSLEKDQVVIGLSAHSWTVTDLYKELIALEKIRNERSELASDSVARREVTTRLAVLQSQLTAELNHSKNNTTWYQKNKQPKQLGLTELSHLASDLADNKFNKSPRIHMELLNRTKPSVNAITARNILLRRMVLNRGEERLGIEGYPPEYALYFSLLEQTGIYTRRNTSGRPVKRKGRWRFKFPNQSKNCKLFELGPIGDAAKRHLKSAPNNMASVSEIYKLWGKAPYGVKNGLMPILVVAFVLTEENQISFYREGVFQVQLKDIDVEFLAKNPDNTSIRLVEQTKLSNALLSELATVSQKYSSDSTIHNLTPINVARGLVSIYEELPQWTLRTNSLSSGAARVRNLFKHAFDPNKFLFEDLMNLESIKSSNEIKPAIRILQDNIIELVNAYPNMLNYMRCKLLKSLHVNEFTKDFSHLRERAKNISQSSGALRLEAFITRLANYQDTDEDIEGLASLAVNKLPKSWVDADFAKANLEIAGLTRSFLVVEAFAEKKKINLKWSAKAIVFGDNSDISPIIYYFDVSDNEQEKVTDLVNQLTSVLNKDEMNNNVVLAALAKVSAEYAKDN